MQNELSDDDLQAALDAKEAKYWKDIDDRDEFVDCLLCDFEG